MSKLKEKINLIKDSRHIAPIFLVALFLLSFLTLYFNSRVLVAFIAIFTLTLWIVLISICNFNKALIILCLILPLRYIGAYMNLIDIGINTWMVISFIAVFGVKHVINVVKGVDKIKLIPLILCLCCCLYGFINFQSEGWYKFFSGLILFAGFYVFYVNGKNINFKQVSYSVIFAPILSAVMSLVYFALFNTSLLMYDGRFPALCSNPNILHIYTTLGLAFLIFLLQKRQCSLNKFFTLYMALSIIGFLTLSKAFFICFLLLSMYLVAVLFNNSKVVCISFCIAMVIGVLFVLFVFNDFFTKLFSRFVNAVGESFIDKLLTGRVSVWKEYIDLWTTSPITIIFGCGVTSLTSKVAQYGIHPHNDYIYFLYRYGIVGTVLIVATLISFIIYSKNKKNFKLRNMLLFAMCLILSLEECITGLLFIPLYMMAANAIFYPQTETFIIKNNEKRIER